MSGSGFRNKQSIHLPNRGQQWLTREVGCSTKSRKVPRWRQALLLCLISALSWYAAVGLSAEPGRPAPIHARLNLVDGDFITGELLDSDVPGQIRLNSPLFAEPTRFAANLLEKLDFSGSGESVKPKGEYSFELSGGDLLFGRLLKLSADEAEIDTEQFGKLQVQTSILRRIERWEGATDLVYMGPNGLSGWERLSENSGREAGGSLILDQPGASVHGEFGLPVKSVIELELSWTSKPNFVLSFGVDKLDSTVQHAFGLDVWDDDLVVRRETAGEADLGLITSLPRGPGGIRLLIYLDQSQGRMQVLTPAGKQIAKLQARDSVPQPHSGFRLTNKLGDVRLERLRISQWRNTTSVEVQPGKSRIHLAAGEVIYGQPERFDSATQEFILRDGKQEKRIAVGQFATIFLPGVDSPRTDGIRLVYRNGARIGGEMKSIREGRIRLKSTGIREELAAPLAGLLSISALQPPRTETAPQKKLCVFSSEGIRMRGALSPRADNASPQTGPFGWQSLLTGEAAQFRPGISGRIGWGSKAVRPSPTPPVRTVPQPAGNARLAPFARQTRVLRPQVVANRPPALHLRTGDTIPCRVLSISEEGLTIESPTIKTKCVPHEKIKAVELVMTDGMMPPVYPRESRPNAVGARIIRRGGMQLVVTPETLMLDAAKQERLLTLPRMQQNNPPTQLVVASNGDILRGRIVALDEKQLRIEVRLEPRDLPRDRIRQIVWLHPDELGDGAAKPQPPEPKKPQADAAGSMRIQTVGTNNMRMTFLAQKLTGDRLSGVHEVLGACEGDLTTLDEILLGSEIETSAAQLAYHRWKLHHAIAPLPDPENSSDDPHRTGRESNLVGKPAPEVKIDLLGGGAFVIGPQPGNVVILDFWASWCGFCLQALPQVHSVAEEFKDRGVKLVAVNVEEPPKQIKAALERLKLPLTVGMDPDGKIGGKYGVTSLPHTVIIDRNGKVARVFVGGSASFDKEVRAALQAVLDEANPGQKKNPEASPQEQKK